MNINYVLPIMMPVLLGCGSAAQTKPVRDDRVEYTAQEYWTCVTRHQDQSAEGRRRLEQCLQQLRQIEKNQSTN